jgi:hypothetical protein
MIIQDLRRSKEISKNPVNPVYYSQLFFVYASSVTTKTKSDRTFSSLIAA